MPTVYKGNLSFTKWLNSCDNDEGPALGDSSEFFDVTRPRGKVLKEDLKPGSIVMIGFTPRLTGKNLSSPSLDPQWVTLLKKTDETVMENPNTPSPKKRRLNLRIPE